MSYVDYEKAQKMGLKAFKNAIAKGENEYLPVLDEILDGVEIAGEVNLGTVDIPISSIVGTSNMGRTYAFANNFMPLLDFKTEFGSKWSALADSQIEEGIREPIKVFEYLNKFYVVEGNKRVSVMRYFGAVSIPAVVTRKLPVRTDELENKIYYEFLDFYKLTKINYIWFSQEGCFKKLLELTSENPTEVWTEEQMRDFGSANHNFSMAFKSIGGEKLPMTITDAFLIFIDIYGYDVVKNLTENEMKVKIKPLWEEFEMESKGRKVELFMEPSKTGRKKLMEYFVNTTKKATAAFIFDKRPEESEWFYAHELGRLYLDENCADYIKTIKAANIYSEEEAYTAMEDLVKMGANVFFVTAPQRIGAALKIAATYPDVKVFNCSLNTSHKIVRTYYSRLYEVKFLAGMIAGALAENGRIGYLADYPIIGTPANINAFALGAKMVNPRATVFVEWTKLKNRTREEAIEHFREHGVNYISDQVMIVPKEQARNFGLYSLKGETPVNLCMPVNNWGVFYKKLIDEILDGSYANDDDKTDEDKAINYWWGLSAGVVDIICSKNVPAPTRFLVEKFKQLIIDKKFSVFEGEIKTVEGEVKTAEGEVLSPWDIMSMDYFVENVEGYLPNISEFIDTAKDIVSLKGVTDKVVSDELEE